MGDPASRTAAQQQATTYFPDCWLLCACVCLPAGESIAACAVREVLEETGLHIRNNQGAWRRVTQWPTTSPEAVVVTTQVACVLWCGPCCAGADVEGFSSQLQQPIPFAAVDSIVRDEQGQLKFHYVVVEVSHNTAHTLLQLGFTLFVQHTARRGSTGAASRLSSCRAVLRCAAVQAAAMAADPDAVPVASDDVDGAQYVQVDKLRQLESESRPM